MTLLTKEELYKEIKEIVLNDSKENDTDTKELVILLNDLPYNMELSSEIYDLMDDVEVCDELLNISTFDLAKEFTNRLETELKN